MGDGPEAVAVGQDLLRDGQEPWALIDEEAHRPHEIVGPAVLRVGLLEVEPGVVPGDEDQWELGLLGIVDGLIPEPAGGAHTDPHATISAIKSALIVQLDRLRRIPIADLLSARYERYRHIGVVVEPLPGAVPVVKKEPFWRRIVRPA